MKIIFDRDILLSAILPAANIASSRNTIAAIEGIQFTTDGKDACILSAYDLEKGMRQRIGCVVEEEGSFIINAAKLTQIVRTMPDGTTTIEVDPKTLKTSIQGGKAVFELQALDGGNFPDLPDLRGRGGFIIKSGIVKEIFNRSLFAVAQNDIRPALNGLYVMINKTGITSVGCDGSRLALNSHKADVELVPSFDEEDELKEEVAFILPGKSVTEVTRLLGDDDDDLTIKLGRKHIIFLIGEIILFTRVIDGEYLDYRRFIPEDSSISVNVDSSLFLKGLERALLVTEDRQAGQSKSAVICTFTGNILNVSSSSITGRVSDEIFIEKSGDDLEIGFNCKYLTDAMRICDGDMVKLSLKSPTRSMVIEPLEPDENKKYLLLVLPVRLNK